MGEIADLLAPFFQALKRSLEGQLSTRLFRALFPSSRPGEDMGFEEEDQSVGEAEAVELGPEKKRPSGLPLDELKERFAQRLEARENRQRELFERRERERRERRSQPLLQAELDFPETEEESMGEMESAAVETQEPAASAIPPLSVGDGYALPGFSLLETREDKVEENEEEIERQRKIIQDTIDSFGIDADVGQATHGSRVTLFEVTVARGVKVEAISRIINNLSMDLAALSLRVLAPVPGQDYVGIEVPNKTAETVWLGAMLDTDLWRNSNARLPLLMGRNIRGADVLLDLTRAPHLLVAGATGSGKSVCLNSMIISLLYRFSPDDLRLILVDPKYVEFSIYNSIPHLLVPVINDAGLVVTALHWVIREMMRRYRLLAAAGTRNLDSFNSRPPAETPLVDEEGNEVPAKLPRIVMVIDELADVMMTSKAEVEVSLARIAQMSRAVGIHLIIATQRPSVNVITGVIKANFPTRVAFQVTSQVDSRTILDGKGAEALLGSGDMLFQAPGAVRPERLQSPFLDDAEIEKVVQHVSGQGGQDFDLTILESSGDAPSAVESGEAPAGDVDEELVRQAIAVVVRSRKASTSYIQRRLRIGYNRAAIIMEALEARGIVGPQIGSSRREILVDSEEEVF